MNTLILTSIYQSFWGTEEFMKSTKRLGLPVHNVWKTPGIFTGHADSIKYNYEGLLHAKDCGYDAAIYTDGADSIFLKKFDPPPTVIIYSTEKAIWPPTEQMKAAWKKFYDKIGYPTAEGFKDPYTGTHTNSPWKYLNGGGWCGPVDLLIEFFERYGLNKLKGDINGQDYQALAFLKAEEQGFPIVLDTQCKYFQTTGFEYPGDFTLYPDVFINNITNTSPSLLHGNGRTGMQNLYKLYNK